MAGNAAELAGLPLDGWRAQAACLGHPEPDIWHAHPSEEPSAVAEALSICATCPVINECLQDAIDQGDRHGIRGGVLAGHRPTPKSRERSPADCGTARGHRAHLRWGEPVCPPCREANRLRQAETQTRKRAQRDALLTQAMAV